MRLPLAIMLIICLHAPLHAKKKAHASLQIPFQGGERLEYKAYYNWGFLWLDAANVLFTVRDSTIGKEQVYVFESSGSSLKEYDWFFKVRNYYRSGADCETLDPIFFSRNTLEGDIKSDEQYRFDHGADRVYISSENSNEPFSLDTLKIERNTFDLLTAIYYARTVDFNSMREGEKIPVKVISDGDIYSLYLRYRGKEEVAVRGTEYRYRCAKFTAMLIEGTVFKAGEDMTVWITDDASRIPVQVESKIAVGSVKAILMSVSGNKYPISSRTINK